MLVLCCAAWWCLLLFMPTLLCVLGSRENVDVDYYQILARGIRPPPTLLRLYGDCCGFILHRTALCTCVERWDSGELFLAAATAVEDVHCGTGVLFDACICRTRSCFDSRINCPETNEHKTLGRQIWDRKQCLQYPAHGIIDMLPASRMHHAVMKLGIIHVHAWLLPEECITQKRVSFLFIALGVIDRIYVCIYCM